MGPKKAASAPNTGITGYDSKETKLLAGAFVSSTGVDKVGPLLHYALCRLRRTRVENPTDSKQYDYTLFASLTGFTEGTLKKFWPPLKRKVTEDHPNFSKHLTGGAPAAAPTAKVTASKKRKAADTDADTVLEPEAASADDADNKTSEGKTRKASAKGRRGKKAKTEDVVKQEDHSADTGEGEFVYSQKVALWLESTDGVADLT